MNAKQHNHGQDGAKWRSHDVSRAGPEPRLSQSLTVSGATAGEDTALTGAEHELVIRAQLGDLEAFEGLARRYQRNLFGLALRMLSDRGEAEDVVQETLIASWQALPTLAEPMAFRGWLYQIATRRCLGLLRARVRHNARATADDDLRKRLETISLTRAGIEDPGAQVEHRFCQDHFASLVSKLSDDQRVCWILRELHHLSYSEVATATGLSVSTVRGRLARAREHLARGMTAFGFVVV